MTLIIPRKIINSVYEAFLSAATLSIKNPDFSKSMEDQIFSAWLKFQMKTKLTYDCLGFRLWQVYSVFMLVCQINY